MLLIITKKYKAKMLFYNDNFLKVQRTRVLSNRIVIIVVIGIIKQFNQFDCDKVCEQLPVQWLKNYAYSEVLLTRCCFLL